jgi:hypothetical protein
MQFSQCVPCRPDAQAVVSLSLTSGSSFYIMLGVANGSPGSHLAAGQVGRKALRLGGVQLLQQEGTRLHMWKQQI